MTTTRTGKIVVLYYINKEGHYEMYENTINIYLGYLSVVYTYDTNYM